ncbi:hypothetical protein [Micromonospora sp. KLBMP9576]|uniref:hypothetical protein n=1 Tax=Micromonospora sp. KLBMP9576 TaxID=3424769 RepID=UPI003D8C0BE4
MPVGDAPTWQQRRRPEARPDEWRTDDLSGHPRRAGYVTDLPTDPEQMLRYLREQPDPVPLPAGADREALRNDPWCCFNVGAWLLEGYLPPQSRGALFQALAQFPGAAVVPGEVRDAAGRRGVALRWPGVTGAHWDLIFDPATHAYLGNRVVLVRDGRESLDWSTAVVRMAIVDRSGQAP